MSRVDVISEAKDVSLFRERLGAHVKAGTPLASHIKHNEELTEFWLEPNQKSSVLYKEGSSLRVTSTTSQYAYGRFEEGVQVTPSLIQALNINPLTGEYEPVMEQFATGCMRGRSDDCPFTKLTPEQEERVRWYYPEYVETDEGVVQRGLIWEYLS